MEVGGRVSLVERLSKGQGRMEPDVCKLPFINPT